MEKQLSKTQQDKLDELRRQLAEGELTRAEVADLLETEIYAALGAADQPADNAWLDACSDMMAEMDAEQSAAWPEHQQQNWEAIRKAIRKEKRRRRFPWKQLVAVAASVVLVFLMGISLTRSRYQGTQTEDGQIYELRGQKEEIGGGQSATASEDGGTLQELETTSYEEIVAFLGLTPPMPMWAPDGWEAEPYYASKISEDWAFSVFYLHPDMETMLNFDCYYAADLSTMATIFPQDGEGEDVVLENGQSVYLSTNAGDTLAIWQEGNMLMYISGPITMDELITMVYNTQGGYG